MKETILYLKELIAQYIPEFSTSLNPPATEQEIQMAEDTIGFRLPDDVRELYKIHNGQIGQAGLFCGLTFLSIQDAVQEWKTWNEASEGEYSGLDTNIISVPTNHIKEVYINSSHFPISKDYGGNNISVDLDPDTEGKVGQIINSGRDEEIRYVIAQNITAFFQFIIGQIENGNIRVEREDQYLNWYLKSPVNSHFLDTLKELELPFGFETNVKATSDLRFEDWINNLNKDWRGFIIQECGSPSNWEELKRIKRLNLLEYEFNNIQPLTEFSGLRDLILTGNPITDLSPLNNLKDLKILYLAKTPITSIDGVLGLPNLAQLNLYNTKVVSLHGITQFKKLKSLSISSTSLSDFDEVGKIKNLIELDLSMNTFSSFEPLRGLKKLKELNLSNTNFSDTGILSDLHDLDTLKINNTEVKDFTPLASLEKLRYVTCEYKDFIKVKDLVRSKVNFGISGEMTEQQKEYWRNYCMS